MLDLESLGHAAGVYQLSPNEIRAALSKVGAPVQILLNDVAYFDQGDVARAVAEIKQASSKLIFKDSPQNEA